MPSILQLKTRISPTKTKLVPSRSSPSSSSASSSNGNGSKRRLLGRLGLGKKKDVDDNATPSASSAPLFETLGGGATKELLPEKEGSRSSLLSGETVSVSEDFREDSDLHDDDQKSRISALELDGAPNDAPTQRFGMMRMASSRNLVFETRTGQDSASLQRSNLAPKSSPYLETNHRMINVDRARYGLSSLKRDIHLDAVARSHAEDLASRNQGSLHYPKPASKTAFARIGANVCRGRNAVRGLHKHMILESPSDKANMLDASFTHMGVGTAVSRDGVLYLCQIFGEET